ncbi:hypothetical protein [Alteriqipengyuania lutimaris]|uniref:Ferrochelatase n=1 Tax=Alteriqipengyuania lutimaris TaxID=1538146 RepID=A0A395LPB2_9SPHN|nr:hypothetical protein [Alteriqipengyuania lutimaris]MBB3032544.1 hypothetical protein [Alteriqipengyuania lutimaris]RDS78691.1 hypothetical protein DL238_12415 [Alteriqipengyuania lutimaris]
MTNPRLVAALAGAALAVTPIAAQAEARSAAPVDGESSLGGSPVAAIIAAAIAGLIVVATVTSTDDEDDAVSP